LKVLKLSGNWDLTDRSILAISIGCTQLHTLTLKGIPDVEEASINLLLKRCACATRNEKQKGVVPKHASIWAYELRREDRRRACVRIQRAVRQEQKRRDSITKKIRRAMRLVEQRKVASEKVQSSFRRLMAIKIAKQLAAKREAKRQEDERKASTEIQRIWRGLESRRQTNAMREELARLALAEEIRVQMALEEVSALILERIYRGHLGRQIVAAIREQIRLVAEARRALESKSANTIQTLVGQFVLLLTCPPGPS
jgi:hypothetical protein